MPVSLPSCTHLFIGLHNCNYMCVCVCECECVHSFECSSVCVAAARVSVNICMFASAAALPALSHMPNRVNQIRLHDKVYNHSARQTVCGIRLTRVCLHYRSDSAHTLASFGGFVSFSPKSIVAKVQQQLPQQKSARRHADRRCVCVFFFHSSSLIS